MKTLVVYQSTTGFTEKYATWIGEALSCEVKELKEVTNSMLAGYERVIYGGSLIAANIKGLDKIRKYAPKNLVVFAVGATPFKEDYVKQVQEQNHLTEELFYYMQGGVAFDKLKFFPRKILQGVMKSKESFDHTDKANIQSLVDALK